MTSALAVPRRTSFPGVPTIACASGGSGPLFAGGFCVVVDVEVVVVVVVRVVVLEVVVVCVVVVVRVVVVTGGLSTIVQE